MSKEFNLGLSSPDYGKNLGFTIGIVKNNHDPAEHGRLQVFLPAHDNDNYKIEDLPWALQITPFGGVTANLVVGREDQKVPGLSSYGQFMVPKNGAQVLIGFLDGNPDIRFWMGCINVPEYNRTIPGYIDGYKTELDGSGLYPQQEVSFLKENQSDAGLDLSSPHFKSRGGYERSISYPSNKDRSKPVDNGYARNQLEPDKSDSQTFVPFRTPGGHYMVASDVNDYCRVRLKTTAGNQIIFDDTGERIYISTAKGRNWVELDETNGRVYIYSDSKISINSKNDLNLSSDNNINIVAKGRLNLTSSDASIAIQSKHSITALSTHSNINISASRSLDLSTFNGPKAAPVSEKSVCESPEWHGSDIGRGHVYTWPESGGSNSSDVTISSKQKLKIYSSEDMKITSQAEMNITSSSNFCIASSSNLSLSSESDAVLYGASSTSISSPGPLRFDGSSVGLLTIDTHEGALYNIQTTGGTSPPIYSSKAIAASKLSEFTISDKIIKPNHEPWSRDEDESKCNTTRGKYWN